MKAKRRLFQAMFLSLLSISPLSALQYQITDLGQGRAYDINNSQQIIIRYNGLGYLYEDGVRSDIAALGGTVEVNRINNAGQIVGHSGEYAFMNDGTAHSLGTLGGYSHAYGINDNGIIAGGSYTAGFAQYQPVIYENGGVTNINPSAQYMYTTDINNSGTAIVMSNPTGISTAYLYTRNPNPNFLSIGGYDTSAYCINNNDMVVGASSFGGNLHAYIYSAGSIIDLGTLNGYSQSVAQHINDAGIVVGSSQTDSNDMQAFVYCDNQMYNLNDLVIDISLWTLEKAQSVNDMGEIVGWGTYDGEQRAFLLTPVLVPEPMSIVLLLGAIAGLLTHKIRRL